MKNFYLILDVRTYSTPKEITQSYQAKLKEETNSDAQALLKQAYETLVNPYTRLCYNSLLEAADYICKGKGKEALEALLLENCFAEDLEFYCLVAAAHCLEGLMYSSAHQWGLAIEEYFIAKRIVTKVDTDVPSCETAMQLWYVTNSLAQLYVANNEYDLAEKEYKETEMHQQYICRFFSSRPDKEPAVIKALREDEYSVHALFIKG